MAHTPTDEPEISDADLDEAIQSGWGNEEQSTEAPEPAAPEPVSDETSAPQPDNLPPGDATPEPEPAAQPAPVAASEPSAPVGTPFQFKASGRDLSVPYALALPDGSVVIPKDKQDEFRRELASSRELQANFRNLQRERERERKTWQSQRTEKDAQADASIALMAELVQKTPEEQWQYLQEFHGNIPRLQLDLERRQLAEEKKRIEEQQRGPQLSPEEQEEHTAELAVGELDAEWSKIAAHPDLAILSPTEQQQFRDRWAKKANRLVRAIRTPQEAQQYQGKVGEQIFDPTEFYEDLNYVIGIKKQAAPKPQPTKAAEANAQRNADLATRKPNAIPPTVRNAPPVGQPRDRKTGQFTTAGSREFKKYLMSDADEDDAA